MKNYIIMLVILVASSVSGYTQDVASSTIRWNSNRFFDGVAKVWRDEATYVVCEGGTKVKWFNANGALRKSFQIAEVIGEWPDRTQPGLIQYEGMDITNSCTITIQKSDQETRISLILGPAGPQVYELLITSSEVL